MKIFYNVPVTIDKEHHQLWDQGKIEMKLREGKEKMILAMEKFTLVHFKPCEFNKRTKKLH